MAESPPPQPSDAELEILQVLWNRGPSTVRDVWEQITRNRDIGYTTTLKQMQVMTEKGLLHPNKAQRSHLYRPEVAEAAIGDTALKHFVKKVFRGSAYKLVVRALSQRPPKPEEIAEIRKLLERLENRDKTR